MMLKIGQIEYANCTPLFQVLKDEFPCSEYQFIKGVPAVLNAKLLSGDIDVCPSSSIEYAKHSELYTILPELSISSIGAVSSVLLFSKLPVEKLDGTTVALSSESATSVNLLKLLLTEKYGCECDYRVAPSGTFVPTDDVSALLLIGDAALKNSMNNSKYYIYDLGDIWYNWTGKPFVFALWLCRNEVSNSIELKNLAKQLIHSKRVVPEHIEHIAKNAADTSWLGYERTIKYWRYNISYELDELAQEGLILYYTKCFNNGLISAVPPLKFVSISNLS